MLTITHENSPALYQINAYQSGSITVNNQEYHVPIIIMPDFLAEYNSESFKLACNKQPDVILISNDLRDVLSIEFIKDLRNIEYMSSAAACRTYTVLAAEHRVVMALLVP